MDQHAPAHAPAHATAHAPAQKIQHTPEHKSAHDGLRTFLDEYHAELRKVQAMEQECREKRVVVMTLLLKDLETHGFNAEQREAALWAFRNS